MSVKKRKIRDSHISLESLNPEEEKKLLDNDLLKNAEANSDVDLKMNENEDEWKDKNDSDIGKSLSEALIFASTNPQYDDRFFIELQVQYMKIPSSNLGRTCCVQNFFLIFRTIFVHNMFSPCSAKRRASDKDLPALEVSLEL